MKAPPSHTFIDIDTNENDVVDNFWDSGKKKKQEQANSNNNVPDLLKWISDVTIKRRKYRKRYRCSHLLAEAVLSNTLRNARQDLAMKQEEKRRKAHQFSYQLSIKFSKVQDNDSHVENLNNNNEQDKANYISYNNYSNQTSPKANEYSRETNDCQDEHVQACISSLDNFFSELKSIKV